ncbi:MAG TPA: hypothetical protein PKE45_18905, partial [Caldilineaceae bacterium]|nr:hypothetical protein [Caldilineaceae bacterium]
VTDPNTANNSATDTDTINPGLPVLAVLDNFDRANANTLNNGSNWSQAVVAGASSIRVNNNQALCGGGALLCTLLPGQAIWNNPTGGFGASQGAALTFAGATFDNVALFLKASGGTANLPANFIRVRYQTSGGGQVVVATTANGGISYTTLNTFNSGAFAAGDTLTAAANSDGSVDVWKTTAANVTTYIGHSASSSFTGTGRIGMQLPNNARVDNFKGGDLNLIVVAVARAAAAAVDPNLAGLGEAPGEFNEDEAAFAILLPFIATTSAGSTANEAAPPAETVGDANQVETIPADSDLSNKLYLPMVSDQ